MSTEVSLKENVFQAVGFWLMITVVALSVLFYGTVHQPVIALFYAAVGLMVAVWAISTVKSGYLRFERSHVTAPVFLAGIYGIFQLIPFGYYSDAGLTGIPNTISSDPNATQVAAFHFFILAVFLSVSLVFVDSSRRLRQLLNYILVFGGLYAFYAILQLVLSPGKIYGIYSSPFANPIGSFVNRHNFAAYMEMSILLPAGLLIVSAIKPDRRLLYFTGIGLMGIALLLSGSRGGFVSIFAGLCFLLVISGGAGKKGSNFFRFGGVAAIIIAIAVGSYFISAESTTFQRISETTQTSDVTTNRTQIWNASVKIIADGMPFGVGLGAFGVNYSRFDPMNGLERVEQAHNDYLELLATAGIPGILIAGFFLFLLVKTGKKATSARDRYIRGAGAGAAAGIFSILVHSLFDFVLHTTAVAVLFLILVCVLTVCARMAELEPPEKRRKRNVTPINDEIEAA